MKQRVWKFDSRSNTWKPLRLSDHILRTSAAPRFIPYLFNQRRTQQLYAKRRTDWIFQRLFRRCIFVESTAELLRKCSVLATVDRKIAAATDISIRANKSGNHVCRDRGSAIKFRTRAATQGRGPFTLPFSNGRCLRIDCELFFMQVHTFANIIGKTKRSTRFEDKVYARVLCGFIFLQV